MSTQKYLTPAFYFSVSFIDNKQDSNKTDNYKKTSDKTNQNNIEDMSFHEVAGITTELTTEEVKEGGENRFVHNLPTGTKQGKIILKKGIGVIDSTLIIWCKNTLEGGLINPIVTRNLQISLLNENHQPEHVWDITNAFPVAWETEEFKSTKNEIAVEKIELHFNELKRVQ